MNNRDEAIARRFECGRICCEICDLEKGRSEVKLDRNGTVLITAHLSEVLLTPEGMDALVKWWTGTV